MTQKLNSLGLGYAFAIMAAIMMLLLGILGNLGIYESAAKLMQQTHLFFSLDVLGIVTGMIEAAIISFICGVLLGWIYNGVTK